MKPMRYLFLMCSERSGSNLIARMMGSHPDCCAPPPAHLLRLLVRNRAGYGDLELDDNWRLLVDDLIDLLDTSLVEWKYRPDRDRLLDGALPRSLAALLRDTYEQEARLQGCSVLFIKENHLYDYLPFVRDAFPGAKLVAMTRDPRDMALSWKNSAVLRGGVVRAAGVWQADQTGLRAVADTLPADRRPHCLRYEDLLRDPAGELSALCGFCGLPMRPDMLEFHRDGGARRQAGAAEPWKNLDRSLMRDNYGKFRTGLSVDEIAYVEAVCGETMRGFGYEPETEGGRPLPGLLARLQPLERADKPGYRLVSERERRIRRARESVVRRIEARQPVAAPDDVSPADRAVQG